uniref:Uncharacterized protein n=1 Tax=Paramormyrops kingsleyae TaxID=1676925 RepID=A0A3B3RSW0_9TELE
MVPGGQQTKPSEHSLRGQRRPIVGGLCQCFSTRFSGTSRQSMFLLPPMGRAPTCRCRMVKTTGSDRYTLLLSLLMVAVMTGELTMTAPRCLYRTKAILISPGGGTCHV